MKIRESGLMKQQKTSSIFLFSTVVVLLLLGFFSMHGATGKIVAKNIQNIGVPIAPIIGVTNVHMAYAKYYGPGITKIRNVVFGSYHPPIVVDEITPNGIYVFDAALDAQNNYNVIYTEGSITGSIVYYRSKKVTEVVTNSAGPIDYVSLHFDSNNNPYIIAKERSNPTPFSLFRKINGAWQSVRLLIQASSDASQPFSAVLNKNSGNIHIFYYQGPIKSPQIVHEAVISPSGAVLSDVVISGQTTIYYLDERIKGFVDFQSKRDVLITVENSAQMVDVYLTSSYLNWVPKLLFSENRITFHPRNVDLVVNQYSGTRSDILIPAFSGNILKLFRSGDGINFASQNILTKPANLDAFGVRIAKHENPTSSSTLYIAYSLSDPSSEKLYVIFTDNYLTLNPVWRSVVIDDALGYSGLGESVRIAAEN